jgi:hypothetical protein
MYAMVIRGVDIVLGSQWLASIGTIRLNLQKQFLRFYENEKKKIQIPWNQQPTHPNSFIQQNE